MGKIWFSWVPIFCQFYFRLFIYLFIWWSLFRNLLIWVDQIWSDFDFALCFWSSDSIARVQRAWDYEKVWCSPWYWGSWYSWHCFKTEGGDILDSTNGIQFRQPWFWVFPCFSVASELVDFLGAHCCKNLLGGCERETSGCNWRSEAGFAGFGKQGP